MSDNVDKAILIAALIGVVLWLFMLIGSTYKDHRTQLYKKYPECATACKPHICIRYKERVNND